MVRKGTLQVGDVVEKGEIVLLHIAAIIGGLILMIVGLAMGVSMVLLPVGVVVGLAGFAMFVWGLLDYSSLKSRR
jgi:hypothetical protein